MWLVRGADTAAHTGVISTGYKADVKSVGSGLDSVAGRLGSGQKTDNACK